MSQFTVYKMKPERLRDQNKLILNAAREGICILDLEGNATLVNLAAAEMIGWNSEELIGKYIHEILHPRQPDGSCPGNGCKIYATLKDGEIHRVDEGVFWKKDGTNFPVEYTSIPIREDDKLIGGAVVFTDITERKRAKKTEEALRESLDQLSKKSSYETIISSVTRCIHQSINLQDVLDNAVDAMSNHIEQVNHVGFYLVEGQEVAIKAYTGFPDWFIEQVGRIPYPKGFTWKTIIDEKPRYVADVDQDTAIGPAGRELGTKSYLSMPVRNEDRVIGALFISSYRKNAFDEEELKLLKIVAQQIEIAINNAQQAEALHKALQKVELMKNRLQAENIYLQEEIKTNYNFEEIIGQSPAIQSVLHKVEQIAPTDITVLIQGETGTGKELVARAIHSLSQRRDRTLVKVNCGAISAGLVESELFGHEKGAFTGAVGQRIGRFELADGGTIFLDEVSELPLDTQVKLLQVLQEGEFERVGSSKPISVDVRIIAATNRNLAEAVKSGSFRLDLFYRLNVFPLEMPPLRKRKSDIPLLVNSFLSKIAKKLGKQIHGVSKETMDSLMQYDWRGNIRELQNVLERAAVLEQTSIIQIDDHMLQPNVHPHYSGSDRLEDMERSHILRVLGEADWVIEGKHGAALILGLTPSTLRYRMNKLRIKKPQSIT